MLRDLRIPGAVVAVPAYEGCALLSLIAPALARSRVLVWTQGEVLVCKGDWATGTDAAQVLARHRRPINVRIVRGSLFFHDTWTIGGRYFKVARPCRHWLDDLG